MPKYRKKPIVVEAYQFFQKENKYKWPQWLQEAWNKPEYDVGSFYYWPEDLSSKNLSLRKNRFFIYTLEGPHAVNEGDYIIKGVKGELYPCKPDIFEQTYEPFEEE